MISKMVIIAGMFLMLVWIGVKAGKMANDISRQTESNFSDAIKVLQDK